MNGPGLVGYAIALAAAILVCILLYAVAVLLRIARSLTDLQDQVDDLRTRLGVLDPGETDIARATAEGDSAPSDAPPARSPDETLPGS